MRSRYSAFAAGEIDYLVRTLHPDHSERALSDGALRESLGASCRTYRYPGLAVEALEEQGVHAFVTFVAKIFERGIDRSFRERSTFARTPDGFRYLSGEMLPLG